MHVTRKHIRLGVTDPARSAAFYQALLGAAATGLTGDARGTLILESDSPPVVLVLETRIPAVRRTRRARASRPAGLPAAPQARARAKQGEFSLAEEGFALVVPEPEHIGLAAVALWRAGARMRLEDAGLETRDPDGNAWRVRFVPGAKERAILALPGEASETGVDHERR
jgi:catechol 2,3-dioxygenase-like lactoylglutathione lyase family enzyme